jgi:Mycothiol maleylpyruvate isomerase N-terminal domain.
LRAALFRERTDDHLHDDPIPRTDRVRSALRRLHRPRGAGGCDAPTGGAGQVNLGTPRTIPESRAGFRYAPGKWSIRDVIGHIADSERIFAYRALRIARHDKTPLASFDENDYAAVAGFDGRTLADVGAELASVRSGTITLFRSMNAETLALTGTASGKPISVRALAFIILGHERHHLNVIKAKYLSEAK